MTELPEVEKMYQRAAYFDRMSERMKHNQDSPFGGAAVVVLPGGETIEVLVLDPSADEAQFLSVVATRLQEVTAKIDKQRQASMAYGR